MSRAYATPLRLEIKPSPIRRYFYIALILISSLSVLLMPLPVLIQLVIVCLVLYFVWRDYKCRLAPLSLVWLQANDWRIIKYGVEYNAALCAGSFNSAYLMALNFKLQSGQHINVLFLANEVSAEAYRQLRVRFKVETAKIFTKNTD